MQADFHVEDPTSVLQDPAIMWARWAIGGWLDDADIRIINHCIKRLPTRNPVIEIGSFCGLSAVVTGRILQIAKSRNRLICVDPWRFEGAQETLTIPGS